MSSETFLKFFCTLSFYSLSAWGMPLSATQVSYEQKNSAQKSVIYEHAQYEDGSVVRRPVSLWYQTKVPLQISILNDFTPPPRTSPGSKPHRILLETTGKVRSTGLAIVLSELTNENKNDLYKNCDSATEWTAAAQLVDGIALHRPIHNVPAALSDHGMQKYFNAAYVVCVEKLNSTQH